jgi:hypothetical protein
MKSKSVFCFSDSPKKGSTSKVKELEVISPDSIQGKQGSTYNSLKVNLKQLDISTLNKKELN